MRRGVFGAGKGLQEGAFTTAQFEHRGGGGYCFRRIAIKKAQGQLMMVRLPALAGWGVPSRLVALGLAVEALFLPKALGAGK